MTEPSATLLAGHGEQSRVARRSGSLSFKSFRRVLPVRLYGSATSESRDASPTHGAVEGGAELVEGECYKFSVVTNTFETVTRVLRW